jgi:hypothetical protein
VEEVLEGFNCTIFACEYLHLHLSVPLHTLLTTPLPLLPAHSACLCAYRSIQPAVCVQHCDAEEARLLPACLHGLSHPPLPLSLSSPLLLLLSPSLSFP